MNIETVKISNFWCFGEKLHKISLSSDLTVFIGANGSGKTAVMQALLRMFAYSGEQRRVRKSDFHVGKDQRNIEDGAKLVIEAILAFPELEENDDPFGDDASSTAVPQFFRHMTIKDDGVPKCRLRLEAVWTDDGTAEGDIQQSMFVITSLSDLFEDKFKNKLLPSDRARIRMTYVPAIRTGASSTTAILKGSLWKAIAWSEEMKEAHSNAKEDLDAAFQGESALDAIIKTLNQRWLEVHRAGTDTTISFSPMDANFESFLSRIEPRFSPSESGGDRSIHELSDGQKSLFQISLTSAVLDLETQILKGDTEGFSDESLLIPDLTLLAIEEPENNLSPFYLSRILRQLIDVASRSNVQAVISSHSASSLSRIDPEHIRYFRKDSKARIRIRSIILPDEESDAAKYVREAVKAYPEIYFARFVVLGEGDSELIVLPKLAEALDVSIDPSFVAIVPLGGRHVNHFWRLLNDLEIPHATLLDFDLGRAGGGWGRIKYVCEQLKQVGKLEDDTYEKSKDLSDEGGEISNSKQEAWIKFLEKKHVFFSHPLDIDLLMLTAFPDEYCTLDSGENGPSGKAGNAKQAALKEKGNVDIYDDDWDTHFLWYRYLFLGRGKPVSHLRAMAEAEKDTMADGLPDVIDRLLKFVKESTEIDDY